MRLETVAVIHGRVGCAAVEVHRRVDVDLGATAPSENDVGQASGGKPTRFSC